MTGKEAAPPALQINSVPVGIVTHIILGDLGQFTNSSVLLFSHTDNEINKRTYFVRSCQD